jgi:hypothetical protein
MVDWRGACRVLVGKPEGNGDLGDPKHIWEYNIKIILEERERSVDWIDLAQDRDRWRFFVKKVMNPRVS